jgi:hypothetical protein
MWRSLSIRPHYSLRWIVGSVLVGDIEDWFRKCNVREVYLVSKQRLDQPLGKYEPSIFG